MNLQNGTLDTRLPQNIIRNFEIPANVEHDKLNPFKIGGGNAIWATHLPPNVNVWFSTNPNFDNAQKLDYMNRGMRFMSIGSDGLQQQYDNFYIFTEGTWEDTIKIAVSSQGDMVEPILSSNTGDIENVGRVANITKMPVNGASGYNEPNFEITIKNKYCDGYTSKEQSIYFLKPELNYYNFIAGKKYLFEIDNSMSTFSYNANLSQVSFAIVDLKSAILMTKSELGDYSNCDNLYKIPKNSDASYGDIKQIAEITKISPVILLGYYRGYGSAPVPHILDKKTIILNGSDLRSGSFGLLIIGIESLSFFINYINFRIYSL